MVKWDQWLKGGARVDAGQMDIRMLRGVGETRARTLAKMGIATLEDLLLHYPRGYIDLSAPCGILDAPLDRPCAVLATVVKKSGRSARAAGSRCTRRPSRTTAAKWN